MKFPVKAAILSVAGALSIGAANADDLIPGVARRLTAAQYTRVIADTFGPTIKIGGRFDPDVRVDGLIEVGAAQVSLSSTSLAQYDAMARSIATQVLNEENRVTMLPCRPASVTAADDACAAKFLSRVGASLFRRPLTPVEIAHQVKTAATATAKVNDFYQGLALTLASMLTAPEFLFRIESVEADPANKGGYRLDDAGKATRLSFFLWDGAPDAELLRAAQKGELDTTRGLDKQITRMMASPRLKDGVRAFFDDMLQLAGMEDVMKDGTLFPKFNAQVITEAREQTLRTIVAVVTAPKGDYRDIFTTKKTFLTGGLASIYKVQLPFDAPIGSPDYWKPYEFAQDDPRAGILMQTSFVTMNSHPGRSSPTLRGKALREVLLCQKVPAPPADVNFTIVQDTSNPIYKTARERLKAHAVNPVCGGCHKLIDPMGLALENFDGGGSYRTAENGVKIDTAGEFDGVKFTDGAGLGRVLHDNQAIPSCLVQRLSAYGLGRTPAKNDAWIEAQKAAFAKDGYNVPALMRSLALSPEFYRATPTEIKAASNTH